MGLIVQAEELRIIADKKHTENLSFSKFVRGLPSKEFDERVHDFSEEFSSKIDCTKCANCCKSIYVGVTKDEIQDLARLCHKPEADFIRNEVDIEPDKTGGYLRHAPCTFLNGSRCTIYEDRPYSCSAYPHLDCKNNKYRIRRIISEYSVCSIVFHTLESLKSYYNFTPNGQ